MTTTEADVEQADLSWSVKHGPDIAPGTLNAEQHQDVAN